MTKVLTNNWNVVTKKTKQHQKEQKMSEFKKLLIHTLLAIWGILKVPVSEKNKYWTKYPADILKNLNYKMNTWSPTYLKFDTKSKKNLVHSRNMVWVSVLSFIKKKVNMDLFTGDLSLNDVILSPPFNQLLKKKLLIYFPYNKKILNANRWIRWEVIHFQAKGTKKEDLVVRLWFTPLIKDKISSQHKVIPQPISYNDAFPQLESKIKVIQDEKVIEQSSEKVIEQSSEKVIEQSSEKSFQFEFDSSFPDYDPNICWADVTDD